MNKTFVVYLESEENYPLGYDLVSKLLGENNTVYLLSSQSIISKYNKHNSNNHGASLEELNDLPGTLVIEDYSALNLKMSYLDFLSGLFIVTSQIDCIENNLKEKSNALLDYVVHLAFENFKEIALIYNKSYLTSYELDILHQFSLKDVRVFTALSDLSTIFDLIDISNPVNREWDPSCE